MNGDYTVVIYNPYTKKIIEKLGLTEREYEIWNKAWDYCDLYRAEFHRGNIDYGIVKKEDENKFNILDILEAYNEDDIHDGNLL